MAKKHSGWFWGCGLGCLAMTLIAVGLGVLGVRFAQQTTRGFDAAVETRTSLEERFGASSEYVPPPDGVVPKARIEAFLAIRDATAPARQHVEVTFAEIPMNPEAARELEAQGFVEQMRSVLRITRSSMSLGARLGRIFEARNQALLAQGMGLGEYTYIYALAYYSWLGHAPTDGPENAGSADDSGFGPQMSSAFMGRVRKDLLQMLRNQLQSLPSDGSTGEQRAILQAEIEAMESDRRRIPWQGNMPPAIAVTFEPYRARLEASYSPVTNAFELGRNRRQGRFSVQAE
ncbi:MAG: hypothetical protein AAF657_07785 [Acidobacteriota bacterium]